MIILLISYQSNFRHVHQKWISSWIYSRIWTIPNSIKSHNKSQPEKALKNTYICAPNYVICIGALILLCLPNSKYWNIESTFLIFFSILIVYFSILPTISWLISKKGIGLLLFFSNLTKFWLVQFQCALSTFSDVCFKAIKEFQIWIDLNKSILIKGYFSVYNIINAFRHFFKAYIKSQS